MRGKDTPPLNKGRTQCGFTLIELMIVVAMIGILSSVAIPAFSRYQKRARTVEAVEGLNKIAAGAKAYFQREIHVADESDGVSSITESFPDSSSGYAPTQTHDNACAQNGGAFLATQIGQDFAGEPWQSLNFHPSGNLRYRYHWVAQNRSGGTSAVAYAFALGDLDCDGVFSQWRLVLREVAGERGVLQRLGPSIVQGSATE